MQFFASILFLTVLQYSLAVKCYDKTGMSPKPCEPNGGCTEKDNCASCISVDVSAKMAGVKKSMHMASCGGNLAKFAPVGKCVPVPDQVKNMVKEKLPKANVEGQLCNCKEDLCNKGAEYNSAVSVIAYIPLMAAALCMLLA